VCVNACGVVSVNVITTSLKNERKIGIPTFTQCTQLVSCLHTTAASISRLTPDAALFSLLTMGIMMPETC